MEGLYPWVTEHRRYKMSTRKNQIGRPKGSGHDLRRELREVADILVKDPSITPRAAMKRVLAKKSGPICAEEVPGLRTMQRRWQRQGKELLVEARERREEKLRGDRAACSPQEWSDRWGSVIGSYDSAIDMITRTALRKNSGLGAIHQHCIGETLERARASVLTSGAVGDAIRGSGIFGITDTIGSLPLRSPVREALAPTRFLSPHIGPAGEFGSIASKTA